MTFPWAVFWYGLGFLTLPAAGIVAEFWPDLCCKLGWHEWYVFMGNDDRECTHCKKRVTVGKSEGQK